MTPSFTHRQRIETCLSGARPDRTPVALWRHFPVDDQSAAGLAAAVALFQKTYDFDLIKVTPPSSFCLADWGATDTWKGNFEGTREYGPRVIQDPAGWAALRPLSPAAGYLGQQLECLRLLRREFSTHTPLLQTIFSPMAQAKNLVGGDQLLLHLRQHPQELHAGLKRITESTLRFLEEATRTGIDGIFYAVQHGQYGLLSTSEFEEFCRPYDLQILEAARGLWVNMLHLHGEGVMFEQVASYPVQILNWHDRHTPPSLREGQQLFPGVVCGGLRRWESLTTGTPAEVKAEALEAQEQTGGTRFILGTGCVMPILAPHSNILAARHSLD